jgi:hypothetical protein
MKYTFVVNQIGAVEAGLVGKVTVTDLCFLDYLRGWFFSKNAKCQIVNGGKFVWVHYERAVEELPMLFNPEAKITTNKNKLCSLMEKLRHVGLVETTLVGRRLFFRFTNKALELTKRRQRQGQAAATKPALTVTTSHDETVTPEHDKTVTSSRDEYLPPHIDETGTMESESMETPPQSPKGDSVKDTGFVSTQEEEIYAAYPKKVGKPAGLRAIQRALAKYPFDFLIERTRRYAQTYNGPIEFMPNPSTFFNQDRFNDDPATWRRTIGADGKTQPAIIRADKFGCGVSKL